MSATPQHPPGSQATSGTASNAAQQRVVDHSWRRAHQPRGGFLLDWQLDEGAAMDAPDNWLPCGAHRGEEYLPGSPAAYCLRTGFGWRPAGDRGVHA